MYKTPSFSNPSDLHSWGPPLRTPFLGSRRDLAEAQRAFCAWSDPLAAAKALLQWERLTSSDPVATWLWTVNGKKNMGSGWWFGT